MCSVRRVGVTIGLGVAVSATAMISAAGAQDRGDGPAPAAAAGSGRSEGLAGMMRSMGTGPQTPVTVLMAPAVQKELKLTEAQKTKVFDLSIRATESQRDLLQSMFLGGGGDPRAMLAARNGLRRENEQAIAQVLDAKQRERFDQTVLRAEGPLAIARPDVAAKINLNRSQQEHVQGIVAQLQQSQFLMYMRVRRGAVTGDVSPAQLAQVRGMMGRLSDEAVQELGKVVDRKQKAAFNKLLGAPFDLAKLDAEESPEAAAPGGAAKPEEAKADANEKDQAKEKDEAQGQGGRPRVRQEGGQRGGPGPPQGPLQDDLRRRPMNVIQAVRALSGNRGPDRPACLG
jgi:hypothetical protein